MNITEKNEWLDKKMDLLQAQFVDFSDLRKKTRPGIEALKIITIYILIGCTWILLSDEILNVMVKDLELNHKIQMVKGWFYVALTGIVFFWIIFRKMLLFKSAVDRIFEGYEELTTTHEELAAMDETLNQQFQELQLNRQALGVEKEMSDNIINSAPMIVMVLDSYGHITRFNKYAEMLTGYLEDEIRGCNVADVLIPEAEREMMSELLMAVLSGERLTNNEVQMLCKDGTTTTVLWNNSVLHGKDGAIQSIVAMGMDLSERINMENKLNALAYYDNLTQLPNRAMLVEYLNDKLNEAKLNNSRIALVCLDVDHFKRINDTMGHAVGDALIIDLGNLLTTHIKSPNFVARLGGDEFAILLSDFATDEALENEMERITHFVRRPWNVEDQEFFISASFGVAVYPEHGTDTAELIQNADTAMSFSKEKGKDTRCYFSTEMQNRAWDHIQMSSQLRNAIENHEFMLYYQPQIDLKTGAILGVEALIRWNHPVKGFVPPMVFIPFAEETGYMNTIEEWVLTTAYVQKSIWDKRGYGNLKMSINISAMTLTQPGFVGKITEIMAQYNTSNCSCEIEITETAIMDDLDKAVCVLNQLRQLGISIALDDFGTGYSSLTYLQKLPIDILKVDKDFIKNVTEKEEEAHIFETVIRLAHSLNLKVVAEGVETEEQKDFLMNIGCDIGQGYLFSRPVNAQEAEKYMMQNRINL